MLSIYNSLSERSIVVNTQHGSWTPFNKFIGTLGVALVQAFIVVCMCEGDAMNEIGHSRALVMDFADLLLFVGRLSPSATNRHSVIIFIR